MKGSQRNPWFDDWQEAAELSRQRKAVSEVFEEVSYSKELKRPVVRRLEIIKPLHGDPYFVFEKTEIRYSGRKCTAADVDRKKKWKKY